MYPQLHARSRIAISATEYPTWVDTLARFPSVSEACSPIVFSRERSGRDPADSFEKDDSEDTKIPVVTKYRMDRLSYRPVKYKNMERLFYDFQGGLNDVGL